MARLDARAVVDDRHRDALAQALADWFPGHATYLDSALAHWMFHRRFGGKPVVIHRSTARPNHPHAETLTALANS